MRGGSSGPMVAEIASRSNSTVRPQTSSTLCGPELLQLRAPRAGGSGLAKDLVFLFEIANSLLRGTKCASICIAETTRRA